MSNKTTKILLIGLLAVGVLLFGYSKVNRFLKVDSCLDHGGRWNYETGECETVEQKNESENLNGYTTDRHGVSTIKRPDRSEIINPMIDTLLLFKIWTLGPLTNPHADFQISKKEFYVVDYDGNGNMPYFLNKDSITIFYNDFIQKGRILKVTKDSLTIKWANANGSTEYVEWRN